LENFLQVVAMQFALNPQTEEPAVVEINPRVSRPLHQLVKQTGYPIAKIAKLAIDLIWMN
jgi:carbamoyl-phosphate synthase large subunit